MLELFRISLKLGGGLGTLGAALLYFVHIELIKSDLFTKLTQEQTFQYCLYALGLAGVCAICLFLLHFAHSKSAGTHADNGSIAVNNTGNSSSIYIGRAGRNDGSK